MYYYLHGMVTMHVDNSIVVECNGVGYDCYVAHPDDFPIGETMFVFISFYAHEDEQFMVGFRTLEQRKLFAKLTSVSGVGPKTALSLLAASSVERLKAAIDQADQKYLTNLPGIGKKTASQIILDLRGKLVDHVQPSYSSDTEVKLAFEGLKNLGFQTKEINSAFDQIPERGLKAEEYMTCALRILNHH